MTFESAVQRLRSVAERSWTLPAKLPDAAPNIAAARVRLAERIPALAGEALLDWPTLAGNVRALGGAVDRLGDSLGAAALCEAALAGTWDVLRHHPERAVLAALLDHATRPALRAGQAAVRDVIRSSDWTRGVCPACGALPLLAELRASKDGHSRVLRCGRCTAAWAFPRLACPACGERNHARLRHLHVNGRYEQQRVECCLTCGFYVKALARLEPIADRDLFACDLDTLALDSLALESGYQRTASSAA
jgi:formate dehydrogenase accessory protein FdhE